MAEINGITLKKITTFKDHEGCLISQGTVYYKGKALGEWSQDSWGGPDLFHFNEAVLEEEVQKYVNSDYVPVEYKGFFNLECLLGDLINLMSDEKTYKKAVKKGYNTYVCCDLGYQTTGYFTCTVSKEAAKKSLAYAKLQAKYPNGTIKIYNSPDDFKIKVA